jgi:hypothetical protein
MSCVSFNPPHTSRFFRRILDEQSEHHNEKASCSHCPKPDMPPVALELAMAAACREPVSRAAL